MQNIISKKITTSPTSLNALIKLSGNSNWPTARNAILGLGSFKEIKTIGVLVKKLISIMIKTLVKGIGFVNLTYQEYNVLKTFSALGDVAVIPLRSIATYAPYYANIPNTSYLNQTGVSALKALGAISGSKSLLVLKNIIQNIKMPIAYRLSAIDVVVTRTDIEAINVFIQALNDSDLRTYVAKILAGAWADTPTKDIYLATWISHPERKNNPIIVATLKASLVAEKKQTNPNKEYMTLLTSILATIELASSDIPRLAWQVRSDWINVRKHGTPPAVGDGQADDTAAIQAALDRKGDGITVYLPPGSYRITKTLVFQGPRNGCLVVGHGRDTRLVWDGPEGGRMFCSNAVAYSRYVGLSWDGRGKAAVGFDHASQKGFETEVRHEHESFRNFTGFGIRVGHEQKVASAEILYHNCLFEDCGTALAFLAFNDYDNTIDGCEFCNCGSGVFDHKGNFYARNCHFAGSREADFVVGSEHGSSIRRCTSVGSRRFIEERGTIAPLTIEDCHVAAWTDPQYAVHLSGSPVLMFDCSFSRPPSNRAPVRVANSAQKLMLSNNRPAAVKDLVQTTPAAKLYVIPPGRLGGVIDSPDQHFLHDSVAVPGKLFDAVRDFGAKGDGKHDDTASIQAAVDAARKTGKAAIAYLPTGRYLVSRTLVVTGRDYTFGGSGFRCGLVWRGQPGQPLIAVSGVQNVTLANLAVGIHDLGPMNHGDDIHVTSAPAAPCRLILDQVFAFGKYQKAPDKHGIHFDKLPPGSVVDAIDVQGNLRITGSDLARFLFRTSYEGTVTIEGPVASWKGASKKGAPQQGIVGFLTRLATQSKPTLRVRDNRSVVMSEFYNEQSDQHLVFEGTAGQPEGSVTIQGAKMHMVGQAPVVDIRNYSGRIYYGQSQMYPEPKELRFVSQGTRPVRLILAGHFWYGTKPCFELGPEVKLTMVANREVADAGLDEEALKAMAAALDDLRRLGALDREFSNFGVR